VRDDQRERVLVLGADVDEVNVQPVDLGHEVRQGVQLPLALAPVVVRPPVVRQFLHHREPHALGVVGDRLALGPPGRVDAPPQLGKFRFREVHLRKPADSGLVTSRLLCSFSHSFRPPANRDDIAGPQRRLPLQHRKSGGG
jgi:hypothetical protein